MLGMRTCLPCHIPDRWSRGANGFGQISPSASSTRDLGTRLWVFISHGFSNWKKAVVRFKEHHNFYTKPSWLSVQGNSFSRIGVKVWNAIPQALRNLSKNAFKRKLKQILFNILGSQTSYIDLSEIIQIIKSC